MQDIYFVSEEPRLSRAARRWAAVVDFHHGEPMVPVAALVSEGILPGDPSVVLAMSGFTVVEVDGRDCVFLCAPYGTDFDASDLENNTAGEDHEYR